MIKFSIIHVPAFPWNGGTHPETYSVKLTCSRGLGWNGGEFATREEAEACGQRAIRITPVAEIAAEELAAAERECIDDYDNNAGYNARYR